MVSIATEVSTTRYFLRRLRDATRIACALVPFIAGLVAESSIAAPKPPISTPVISCAGATQTTINVQVCAGATGLPAGFTLQWLKAADYAANGSQWLADSDPLACSAGFSGNANLSRYNLAPGECVTVNVGEFLFDNGASTNCPAGLECGTQYVFRAFGHATSTMSRSAFTTVITCATLDCGHASSCTLTQGYWKTHGAVPSGNNEYVWPDVVKANGLQLGNVIYTAADLLSILNKPAAGNGLIALAHQLIAAKLNVAAGADPTSVAGDIATADGLIGGLIVPPLGSGYLAPSLTSGLVTALANYNEGVTGPGHCDDQEPVANQ